jgi:hypothetical protein
MAKYNYYNISTITYNGFKGPFMDFFSHFNTQVYYCKMMIKTRELKPMCEFSLQLLNNTTFLARLIHYFVPYER